MVTVDEVRTYRQAQMFWTDASEAIEVSAAAAWRALESLLTVRLHELPTVGEDPIQVRRASDDAPLLRVGSEIIATAVALRGLIKLRMCLRIIEAERERYLRIAITVLRQHFADVDYRIEPVGNGCRLSYRQGFRSRENFFGWAGEHISLRAREIPETAAILNLWIEVARSASHAPTSCAFP